MPAFLFELELPPITEEITAGIPAHRERINVLFSEDKLLSYSVSVNRNMIWCVVNAEDDQEAMEMVVSFPLFPYFTDVTCHPLLLHNTAAATLPGISLN